MWTTTRIVAIVLAMQAGTGRGCSSGESPAPPPAATPAPTPTPAPGGSGGVFTTSDGVRFRVETVASGLQVPWAFDIAPDGRIFVTERPGRVRIVSPGSTTGELALSLGDVLAQNESGLMGLALDPEFASNRFVYLHYTAPTAARTVNRIVRFREAGGRLGEPAVLLDGVPSASGHAGGRLRFGPDGLLYATIGDGGNESRGQDLGSLGAKILRINRDGTTPRTNPFGSPVYSYGHRNPQGIDWHPATGDLWGTEHGATGNDEINALRPGANYGWDRIEGGATMPGMEAPVTFYTPAVAPAGASFYRGQQFPRFANNLFVATLRGSRLLRLTIDAAARRVTAQEFLLDGTYGRLREVISGPDGLLYISTSNRDGRGNPASTDDRILRLVPTP